VTAWLACGILLARLLTVRVEASYTIDGRAYVTAAETSITLKTGDVTGDGRVDICDAMCVLRWVLDGFYPELQRLDADWNNNGRPDIGDAVLCLRYALGMR